MWRRIVHGMAAWLVGLAALTAGAAQAQEPAQLLPWQDDAFGFTPALVTVTADELFRLDPELQASLQDPQLQQLASQHRLDRILTLIFGADRKAFRYATGASTVAAQTWRQRRGDCLSLAVLVHAAARAANLQGQLQEVPIPTMYDRRGSYDFIGRHVNLLLRVPSSSPLEEVLRVRDVVVDFDPVAAPASRRGRALSDRAVLARFYNNLGVEYLAQRRNDAAYAHFKSAIQTDPSFAPSYGNLAVLYRNAGLARPAEQLLRRALELGDEPSVALHGLRNLLSLQGREAEAARYDRQLQALRDNDPYYWIGLGMGYLDEGEPRKAVDALERAQRLANGFTELHRHLALAYQRTGQQARADEQRALLAALNAGERSVAKLKQKFDRPLAPDGAQPRMTQ